MNVILASGSPRRRVLLGLLVDGFDVIVPDVDETLPPGPVPLAMEQVAMRKADAVDRRGEDVVIAADTAVILDGVPLGKPVDAGDAERMLQILNGRSHAVVTAVAVRGPNGADRSHVQTQVTLDIPQDRLTDYLRSGDWQDKAGAYGLQDRIIQDHAAIDGPWSNVVGLPLETVQKALTGQGLPCSVAPDEDRLRLENPF